MIGANLEVRGSSTNSGVNRHVGVAASGNVAGLGATEGSSVIASGRISTASVSNDGVDVVTAVVLKVELLTREKQIQR